MRGVANCSQRGHVSCLKTKTNKQAATKKRWTRKEKIRLAADLDSVNCGYECFLRAGVEFLYISEIICFHHVVKRFTPLGACLFSYFK